MVKALYFNYLPNKSHLILIAICFLCLSGSLSSQTNHKKILAEIAGEKVTMQEFVQVFRKNNNLAETTDQASIKEYLDLYVNFRLKVKEAKVLGYDTLKSFRQELNGYRAQLAKPYMVDEEATERLIKEAWERSKEDLRASHILVRVDKEAIPADTMAAFQKAMKIWERLSNGEPFANVAAEMSEDPSARDRDAGDRIIRGNRGDLGYFTVFDMIYPFENAAYSLKINQISKPVRTEFGYHLILLTDRKPALGKILAAHILFLNSPGAAHQDSALVHQKAKMVYEKLNSGISFDELAANYSDDRSTADKGGVLQWFGANRMIPNFIEEIYKLGEPGNYSPPFQTQFGWHIVKLLDLKKPGGFNEAYAELKDKVQKNERSEVIKESLARRIKKEYGFKEKPSALNPFLTHLKNDTLEGNWTMPENVNLSKPLFSIGKKKYTQKNFRDYLVSIPKPPRPFDFQTQLMGNYHAYVEKELLNYEDRQLEKKYPEFRALMNEYHDGILLFELTDKKIWSKAVKDTTGLDKYYQEHRYDYMWGERADASVFTFLSEDNILFSKAKSLAAEKLENEEILAQVNKDNQVLMIQRKNFSKGDHELVDKVEWTYGVKETMSNDGHKALVVIHNTLEPGPKELNDARGLVTADYQNYLEKEWIKELRNKYPVKINYDLIPQIKP